MLDECFQLTYTTHASEWLQLKKLIAGFSGGPVVKNLALQCKGHWFSHWSGKIPHAAGQLSLCPQLLSLCLEPGSHNYGVHLLQLLRPGHPRACALQRRSRPRPQLESSPSSPTESPCSAQPKRNIFFKRMTKNFGEDTEQPKLSHTVDEIVK